MMTTVVVPATAVGPQLVLRPWADNDADALVAAYQDPAMHRWTRIPVRNREEALQWLATQRDGWQTGNRLSFAVNDVDAQLVACVVLKNPRTAPEVGYWTTAAARGRGIASRAVDALSAWAFATHGLTKLELRHQVDNVASCRVAHKAGYPLHTTLPATPPFPLDGHLHVRHANQPRRPIHA
jgi:RimJ/RimL family protein N-acetyltransferase